ncbi:hypothetical protein ABXT21_00080 [Ralstonia sp. SM1864_UCD524_TZ4]|uniref:Uncharacterized protein n=1 Tax=Ralstonia solanacearum TaxID=305 RepID=A0A0S4XC73_RALSL|nr:hypothetical protein [Ralstonia pseudosolanacearum]MCL1619520.1 hypothetical protein [Ralstonia pseudosolanacearum CaRs-Mep]CUV34954.1 conserved protein of unknown function [Ralstonia solanacearum]CUV41728.1 conserved protein of unknown function [Ralstonia solanacearum]CUV61563.1 conserved protein of unknown function [Ralstonia solanacearum]
MEDLNQVAATLAAAIYTSEKAAALAAAPSGMPVTRVVSTKRVVELFREVRKELTETQSTFF